MIIILLDYVAGWPAPLAFCVMWVAIQLSHLSVGFLLLLVLLLHRMAFLRL